MSRQFQPFLLCVAHNLELLCSFFNCLRHSVFIFLALFMLDTSTRKHHRLKPFKLQFQQWNSPQQPCMCDWTRYYVDKARFKWVELFIGWYFTNEKTRFHNFVAYRIAVIQEGSDPTQWRYATTEMNPAMTLGEENQYNLSRRKTNG